MENHTINKRICIGSGLVALDVVISSSKNTPPQFMAGGSCGNVLTNLSYLGWETYPIARLANNIAGELLFEDLKKWNVNDKLITYSKDGSTPIIIHRILKDKNGKPKHKFEFRNPENGKYLPAFKPCLVKSVQRVLNISPTPTIFYFDRINRASIELAKEYKKLGAIIFFEPSKLQNSKEYQECIQISDVVKFSEDRISSYDKLYPQAIASIEIQTLGDKGLKFRRKDSVKWSIVPGYFIDDVVDSAGAGDWCTAGFILKIFQIPERLNKKSDEEIVMALKFGQVLGALNCTFEGARGLMYNINSRELLLSVEHILSSSTQKIVEKGISSFVGYSHPKQIEISTLFETV